ncbi:MAG: hypothetical protein IJ763_10270 [Lachnospiraceae bacterium]|nr:hypothetical protein [Lachnospiraceae bacterium]
MKITDKNIPVKTIPKGVWEADHPDNDLQHKNQNSALSPSTDLQGNGYPDSRQNK